MIQNRIKLFCVSNWLFGFFNVDFSSSLFTFEMKIPFSLLLILVTSKIDHRFIRSLSDWTEARLRTTEALFTGAYMKPHNTEIV